MDRRRRPLTGRELRGCWTERAVPGTDPEGRTGGQAGRSAAPRPAARPARGFVPVDELEASVTSHRGAARDAAPASDAAPATIARATVEPADGWDGRVSLFGDLDR